MGKKKWQEIKLPKTNYFSWIMKNIIFAVIAVLTLAAVVIYSGGDYKPFLYSYHKDVKTFSHPAHRNATLDKRYIAVLKSVYEYIEVIKNSTPEDAVILYPEYESFFPENEKHVFHNSGVANKMWAIRFLYPRKIVRPSELESSPYKDEITHVAIVNGRGGEFLPYKLSKNDTFGVALFNATEEEIQAMNNKNQ